MPRRLVLLSVAAVLALALPAAAQEGKPPEMPPEQKAMMEAYTRAGTPGPQHAALARMAGTYSLAITMWHAPGTPPETTTGTTTRTMILGGRVLTEDTRMTMMGQPYNGFGMFGYENATGKHWSTWADDMSTGLMVSEGTCDAQNACTFTGTYFDPYKKANATMRMTTRWTSPTVEVFEMYMPGPDGKEYKGMEIVYTKK